MNKIKQSAGKLGYLFCTALVGVLAGCTTYVEQPRQRETYLPPQPTYVPPPPVYSQPAPVYVPPPAVQVEVSAGSVEIRSEDDFYEPLRPYGRWEVVGSYGRCWVPERVDTEWRPYCNGNWERTDAGWYWESDEPWAWATYHYGRWDFSARIGWYWVPRTQWAPAWVSWHESGSYVGWAPLHPSARVSVSGSIVFDIALISPRAYVFVEPRRFLQPIRPQTVVVNNATIINKTVVNKTVNITNIKIVNNTVINEGPRTQIIEQASGQKVRPVPVRELRRKQEAEVVARQRAASQGRDKKEKKYLTPVRTEIPQPDTKVSLDAQRRAAEAGAKAQGEARNKAKESQAIAQEQRRANVVAAKAHEKSQRNVKESEQISRVEAQQRGKAAEENLRGNSGAPGKPDQIAIEQNGTKVVKKAQKKKAKGKPVRQEEPTPAPDKNN